MNVHECMYVCMCVYMCIYVYMYVYVQVYMCCLFIGVSSVCMGMYECMGRYVHVSVYVCMYVCMHVCVLVCVYKGQKSFLSVTPDNRSLLGLELTDSPVLANHVERLTGSHLPPALCKWSAEGKAVTRCVTGRTAVPCGRRNFTSGVCVKLYRDSSWELNNKI